MTVNDLQLQEIEGELKTRFHDDPDLEKAGNGLELFPLINQALRAKNIQNWMMAPAEKVALIFLLEQLRPKVAIEIGTRFGGSLQVLSKFCDRVYSIDIDPEVPQRLNGKFPNVEYLIGRSDQLLPPLLDRLRQESAELSFALVDGDHSTDGVRRDIDHLLRVRPTVPFYIVMHDSFNPQCRLGLRQANWSANPYVHAVELDFVSGVVNSAPAFRDQLWGGLAMGILLPSERHERFEVTAGAERTFQAVMSRRRPLVGRVIGRAKRSLPARALGKAKRVLVGR